MNIREQAEKLDALAKKIPFATLQAAGREMDELSDQVGQLAGDTDGGRAVLQTLQQSFTAYESLISLWTKAQMDLQDLANHHMNG